VEEVRVGLEGSDIGTFYIDILYRIRGDNDERNLVFPFYVIPDEPQAVSAANHPALTTANGA
jgi:hypothetical protein